MYKKQFFIFFSFIIYFTGTSIFAKPSSVSIIKEIQQISNSVPGTFGISASLLKNNNTSININADTFFPMASTYKIPICMYCLYLIEKGKLNDKQKITITERNKRRVCFTSLGQQVSIKKLINLMIESSDNAASDIILQKVGGGNAVTRWLRKNNIQNMHIHRSTRRMCADYSGLTLPKNENDYTIEQYRKRLSKIPLTQRGNAAKRFYIDKRDTTTPYEMVKLLKILCRRKLINASSKKMLLGSMLRCKSGQRRMVKLLPKNTKVWHKTGSMDGIVSDVGIIKLPNNKGHLVLAIYTNKSITHTLQRERAIAHITKKLFDYFSLNL
jgi:beta-lactamase class A